MDTFFENQCTYTYEHYLQLKRKTMDKGSQYTGYVFLVIFIALLALCLIKKWYLPILAPIVGILFLIYRLFFLPVLLAKYSTRKNREIHKKDVETVNNFYEDHVEAMNTLSKSKTSIRYTEVKELLETKDLYIISMEQSLVLMIDKNGFTKGTKEDFAAFMKEKCTDAKVRI